MKNLIFFLVLPFFVACDQIQTPEASTPEASTPEASTPEASTPEASTPKDSTPKDSTQEQSTPICISPLMSTEMSQLRYSFDSLISVSCCWRFQPRIQGTRTYTRIGDNHEFGFEVTDSGTAYPLSPDSQPSGEPYFRTFSQTFIPIQFTDFKSLVSNLERNRDFFPLFVQGCLDSSKGNLSMTHDAMYLNANYLIAGDSVVINIHDGYLKRNLDVEFVFGLNSGLRTLQRSQARFMGMRDAMTMFRL